MASGQAFERGEREHESPLGTILETDDGHVAAVGLQHDPLAERAVTDPIADRQLRAGRSRGAARAGRPRSAEEGSTRT